MGAASSSREARIWTFFVFQVTEVGVFKGALCSLEGNETQNFNIHSINEAIIQTQKQVVFFQ